MENIEKMTVFHKYWSNLFYNRSTRHEQHEHDTNDTNATQVRHGRHEWDTSDTSATRVVHKRHECYTSATRAAQIWHIFINIFSPPTPPKKKIIRRGTISFQELLFGNASFPCQNAFEKCTTKTELCKNKSYIKKLYTRL